jgi:DNA-binding response OmpR family regulator
MLRKLLTMKGFHLVEAEDAARALAILGELGGAAALVISDNQLVETTGADLAREVKQQFPGLRVLLMCNAGSSTSNVPFCDGLLCKPFTPAELVEAVRSQLEGPAQ